MSRRSRIRKSRRRKIIIAAIICSAPIIWAVGLWIFAANLPQPLNHHDIPKLVDTQADAILVFTGGNDRLNTGFQLLRNNYAKDLFISGVHRGVDVVSLVQNFNKEESTTPCCVTIGYNANDTYGNAKESLAWIKSKNMRRIILVTSTYHIPRSLYYLERANIPLDIQTYPILSEYGRINRWGDLPGTRSVILSEYNKYVFTAFFGIFGGVDYDDEPPVTSFYQLP